MGGIEKPIPGIGARIPRSEDWRFLTGCGDYSDDITRSNLVYVVMVRSSHAHADLKSLDTNKALASEGVLSGADWKKR